MSHFSSRTLSGAVMAALLSLSLGANLGGSRSSPAPFPSRDGGLLSLRGGSFFVPVVQGGLRAIGGVLGKGGQGSKDGDILEACKSMPDGKCAEMVKKFSKRKGSNLG